MLLPHEEARFRFRDEDFFYLGHAQMAAYRVLDQDPEAVVVIKNLKTGEKKRWNGEDWEVL